VNASFVVIVCTRDRPEQLRRCLAALAATLRPGDDRLVVDSASVGGAAVASVAAEAGFRLARAPLPGLSRARNVGLEASTAPLVAFIDDDCVVGDAWSERIEAAFADPGVGFVTGVVNADREARLPIAVTAAGATAKRFGAGSDPTECGHGANMAFRRAALEAVGRFDEELGAGARFRSAEDTDLFWRLLAGGWEGVFDPGITVTHEQWRSTTEALRTSFGYGVGLGALVAKARHRDRDRARRVLRRGVWDNGLRRAGRDLRAGYQTGAASCLVRVAGVCIGAVRAAVSRRR
jgi:GT2 family glycosyltransferase